MKCEHCGSEVNYSLSYCSTLVTANPAKRLKFARKGNIKKDFDADMLVLSQDDYTLQYVVAKGKPLMKAGKVVKFGTFEDPAQCK